MILIIAGNRSLPFLLPINRVTNESSLPHSAKKMPKPNLLLLLVVVVIVAMVMCFGFTEASFYHYMWKCPTNYRLIGRRCRRLFHPQ